MSSRFASCLSLTRFALATALGVAACSEGAAASPTPDASAPEPPPDAGAPPDAGENDGGTVDGLRFDEGFVRAGHPTPDGGFVLVIERPVHLHDGKSGPDRALVLVSAGGVVRGRVNPAPGRELLDVAVHPSGEHTVVEAASDGFHLVRVAASGARGEEHHLVDDAIAADPPALRAGESASPIETHTHDVGRVAADGEDVYLATRTGRHSVIAYRVRFGASGFDVAQRTLVIPAHPITPVALNGGTYDAFGQLDAHYAVHVARDAAGIVYVAVQYPRLDTASVVRVLGQVFGERLEADPDGRDVFVTRLAPNGYRMGVAVFGTPEEDQLYGMRAGEDGVFLAGRSEIWNAEGTGHDVLVGKVDRNGSVSTKRFDLERGDVAFDVLPLGGGELAVLGARGYWQNPNGASVSEEAAAFGRVVRADGSLAALELPAGPRHAQARFGLLLGDGRIAVGGMLDGPGTHSADRDRSNMRARGFFVVRSRP